MATLSPYPSQTASSSHAAEALLDRARRLSNNAYSRAAAATAPTAFAEGEDIHAAAVASSSSPAASPCLSPTTASRSSASLHLLHRNSFNDLLRDHGRKRLSPLSPASTPITTVSTSATSNTAKASSTLSAEFSLESSSSTATDNTLSTSLSSTQVATTVGCNDSQLTREHCIQKPSSSILGESRFSVQQTNNNDNSTDGYRSAQTSCATSQQPQQQQQQQSAMTRQSLTIITRPSALEVHTIRDGQERAATSGPYSAGPVSPPSALSTHSSSSVRRKHHSENGATEAGQLVRGVLMALRDSDPTTISAHAVASAHDIPSGSVLPAGSSTILVRRPAPSASEADTTTAINSHLQQQQQQKAQRSRAESTPISLRVSTEQTCTTVDRSCAPSTISAPKPAAPTPKSISTTANTSICSNMAESISVAVPEQTSAVVMSDQAHRESRSESISLSISTQDNSQVSRNDRIHMAQSFASMSPDVASAAAHSSAAASSKSSKRSSRLFGKLVPKFLQTSSLGPAGGSSSPKSAYPASSTPLSAVETAVPPMLTRQGRSASFAGGASSPMVNKKASQLPALPALDEKLTLPSLPALSGSTLNLEKEWLDAIADPLKTQTTTLALSAAPVSVHGTGLSANSSAFISTNISGPINNINSYSTAAASPASSNLPIVSSFTSPAPSAQKTSFSATDASYPPLHERPQQQSVSTNSDHKVEISNEAEVVQKERFQEGEAKEIQDHASHSPYIIDENCDDDFFLNSVLRKKHSNSCHHSDHNHNSNKSNDAVHSTRPQLPHALSAPYQYGWSSGSSSGSGNGNSHGIGRTPSLSTSFSSSSQASSTVPSPTTPMFVAVGLDEKRSRLSDAVKEWRRSTNAPSGPCNSANVF